MTENKVDNAGWINKLAEESWQAELIISGIAIYGALQLPELISKFGEWAVTYFSPDTGLFMWIILFYLSIASSGLITGFILHFILRAIWVGLIGLRSVYPNGINEDSKMFSKTFIQNLRRDFPYGDLGLKDMDRICSVIFAVNTLILLVSVSLIINVVILYGLKYLLDLILPGYIVNTLGWIVITVLFIVLFFVQPIFQIKMLREKEVLQTKAYKVFKFFSILVNPIFYKPTIYLSFLFQSHSRSLKSSIYFGLITGIVMLFSIPILLKSNVAYFINPNKLMDQYARTEEIRPGIYETNLTEKSTSIYSALIESEVISGRLMKLFIPIFSNEEPIYNGLCGTFEEEPSLTRVENRDNKRAFLYNCYNRYHRITVNDSIVNVELLIHHHPHKESYGVLTYLPTDDFKKGKNILEVEKLTNDSTGIYRKMIIPFWFEGK